MDSAPSDAFVFFGATGDLAYKQIFPALQALIKRGHFHLPIIGIAKSGWDIDRLVVQRTGGSDGPWYDPKPSEAPCPAPGDGVPPEGAR